jgi:two-component system OmpR family response regulator
MAKKILIVEDDMFLQGLASTKLKKEGYEMFVAGDGTEASKILETITPDLFILDIILPGATDGLGILKRIRENIKTSKSPVIMFSNMSDDDNIKKAKELGANEYMVKSNFTLDELADKIKELLK